jgi:SAM-dependent methyltransferase
MTLRQTLRHLRDILLVVRERSRGLDFTAPVGLDEMGLSSERSVHYATAGHGRLKRLLGSMQIGPEDSVIDFGCGKGKAMWTLSRFPFSKVDGVELSPGLSEIARGNLNKLGVRNAQIFTCDAAEFCDSDNYNYIYMCNPFPAIVMRAVVDHIEESISLRPRRVTVVYLNAQCHADVIAHGVFDLCATWRGFNVYAGGN